MRKTLFLIFIIFVLLVQQSVRPTKLSAQTNFVADTFTTSDGTTVVGRTPDIGGVWTTHPSYSSNFTVASNKAYGNSTQGMYIATVPSSSNYLIEMDITVVSALAGTVLGIAGRMDTSANTMFELRYNVDLASVQLATRIGGTFTARDTEAVSWSVGSTHNLKLEMVGNTIKGYIDGVHLLDYTDSGAIPGPGRAGVRYGGGGGSAATGLHMDNFAARLTSTTTVRNFGTLGVGV